jgi:integrase
MALSDAKVRNAKPQAKPYKIADGDGMFLLVTPNGSKYWRFKYYYGGKERLLALGVYPEVSLLDAREKRLIARKALAAGNDPSQAKREAKRQIILKAGNTFEGIAREWFEHRKHEWVEKYAERLMARLDTYVFPKIGNRPITDVNAPDMLEMLRAVEAKGVLDTTHRVMQTCGQIFMYAIATGRALRNPIPDLRGAIKAPVTKHHAYLKAKEIPDFLKRLEAYEGIPLTKLALRLLLLTFVRTTELRAAKWSEIDFDNAEWRIPAERMKMKEQHIVPLSRQSLEILEKLQKISGNREYIFPNQKNLHAYMSENTMLYALYRMGYHLQTTGHGFRSTASTVLNENGFEADVIERQLAHSERNAIRAAYNHAQYLSERRRMMQWWGDYLDTAAKNKQQNSLG